MANGKTKLNSIHEIVLKNRLEQFKKRQREDAAHVQADLKAGADDESEESDLDPEYTGEEVEAEEEDFVEEYNASMSPAPVDVSRLGDDARLPTVREADFMRTLFAARRKISEETYAPRRGEGLDAAGRAEAEPDVDNDLAAERHWRAKIAAESQMFGDDSGEEDMEDGDLADDLPTANYDWGDKYRPRKPRYYNRVHTGYEWTQYNQSHYE